MRQYRIDKHARKMRDRETNRAKHEKSVRHKFNPTSLDRLKEMREAIYSGISDTFKRKVCADILSYYKVIQDTDLSLYELELWVQVITRQMLMNVGRNVKYAIAQERDVTSNRFSPNRMRRHYHRIQAGERGYHAGNREYDEYEYILSTWQAVYGQRWDGEPYQIDHLQPLCTARTQLEVHTLNKIDNLAMITEHDNLSKRGTFPHPIYYIIKDKQWNNG